MRSARYYAEQVRALARASGRAAQVHDDPRARVVRRARWLRRRLGFDYEEAFLAGLLDPRVSADECRRHVSWTALHRVQARLNPGDLEAVTHQKAVFYRFCALTGIPTPTLHGIVSPRAGGVDGEGRAVVGERAFVGLLDGLPDELVVKPSDGHFGRGVRLLRRGDDGRLEGDGERMTAADLYARLAADPDYGTWIVQERLHNHDDLAALAPTRTLHTARIGTLVTAGGRAEVLYALMRLALGRSGVDNFRDGTTGNGIASVDLATGRLGPLRVLGHDGHGLAATAVVPATGARVEGLGLPDWPAALGMVRRAARAVLPTRTVGWDVAFTPRGPLVVEANPNWAPWPGSELGAVLERMRREIA